MTADLEAETGWSAAEERVASLYRALQYTVDRDRLNRGSQIDLVAERHDPVVGRTRIGVEVKDHPGASTPIQEIRDFINNAQNALRRNDFDQVHLVTTGTITRNGKEAFSGEVDIRAWTYEELEREFLQPDAALHQWLDTYRREPINNRFVDVTATLQGASSSAAFRSSLPSTQLLDLALAQPSLGVVVLADYGAGKSTLVQRIKALAIQRRSTDPTGVVPILIELREVTVEFDIEQVALGACRTELGIELPASSFWSLLRNGRFLILLDGFDEITLHASTATREQMLARISPLLFGPSPAILTSRPSYFASLAEYRRVLSTMRGGPGISQGADPDQQRIAQHADLLTSRYVPKGPKVAVDSSAVTYKLDPLTGDQIDRYLEQAADDLARAGTTPREVRDFLDSVYDLSDLISRPIILDMAVTSTVQGVIAPSQEALQDGPSGLYESYAKVRLARDLLSVESRQGLLGHDIRMRFAEECAIYMDERDVLRVEPDVIADVAARTLSVGESDDLEAVLTDLRTCSFLTIDDEGALEFIHRSYQEFFIARRIRADLARSVTTRLKHALRWEYAYFLGSMGYTNAATYQTFVEMSRGRKPRGDEVADNAAQAVLIAREVARDLEWHDRRILEMRRPRLQIIGSTLRGVSMADLQVRQIDFTDCGLDLSFSGYQVEAVTVTNCTGKLEAWGDVGHLSVEGGDLEVSVAEGTESTSFDSMSLRLRSVSPRQALQNVTGRAEIGASTVDVKTSDLRLASSELVDGAVTDSLVDADLEVWDSLAVILDRSVVVVHGARPRTTTSTAKHRSRRIVDEAPAGASSVVVVHPSVAVDRWWIRQAGLVTIGARIPDARTKLLGLFVHEQVSPLRASGPGSLEFWTEVDGTVVMEGWGDRFEEASERLGKVIEKATARSVANRSWFTNHLLPLLEQLGCASEVAGQLLELVAARVSNAGPATRS
jgi:hypothetical protein